MKKIITTILNIAVVLGTTISSYAQTFEYKETGTDFILFDVSIPKNQNDIAYAAGSKFTFDTEGIIIKTEDGGESWNTIYPLTGTSPSFEKIEFINENVGFVAGYDLVMKTTDGGVTWNPLTVGTDVYLYNNLSFYDENIGFVSAQLNDDPYFAIYLTTDGGNSWTEASDVLEAGGIAMDYANQATLYSVGADERIAKSIDGGNTWNSIYSGMIQNYFLSLNFKDADNGVVAGEDGLLKTTHDGGNTWNDFATGYHHFYALAYKGDEIMAGGTDTDIYFSADNGTTWDQILVGHGQNQLYQIAFFENGSGLISGSGGVMIKFNDIFLGKADAHFYGDTLTGSYDPKSQIFNVYATSEAIEEMHIYNLAGQLVASFPGNSTSIAADVSTYPQGIYVVSITIANKKSSLKFIKY